MMLQVPPVDGTLRILLLDDDSEDRRLVCDMLDSIDGAPFEVETAATPEEATALFERDGFDACLLDHDLGAETGFDVMASLVERGIDVPVILLTGSVSRELDLQAMRRGAFGYLVKDEIGPSLLERSLRYAVERKRLQDHLVMAALYDDLTGLPSRRLFMNLFDQAIARSRRSKAPFCLAFIDLNGFKPINDTHGHDAGDSMLRTIGERLSHGVRRSDSVGRVGGDEFVCLLENFDQRDSAMKVVAKLADDIAEPVSYSGKDLRVTASIGVVFFPEDGDNAASLMAAADELMYEAKRERGDGSQGCIRVRTG